MPNGRIAQLLGRSGCIATTAVGGATAATALIARRVLRTKTKKQVRQYTASSDAGKALLKEKISTVRKQITSGNKLGYSFFRNKQRVAFTKKDGDTAQIVGFFAIDTTIQPDCPSSDEPIKVIPIFSKHKSCGYTGAMHLSRGSTRVNYHNGQKELCFLSLKQDERGNIADSSSIDHKMTSNWLTRAKAVVFAYDMNRKEIADFLPQ